MPDTGDLESILLVIVGLIVLVCVVIPLLLFGIELIAVGAVGCVLAASLTGRLLLGRPWVVEARPLALADDRRVLERKVSGWRRSNRLIGTIVSELSAGRDPGTISDAGRTLPA